ncbi:hypothetical protein BRYFOR_07354 [Marvinbryantia formatexigens DSM 14469]|uniref:Uncharacterized protein n=1 Tax=Marvinbryantia formatexigens DSM 14469 TaxID=478749 RepID=C6LFF3_9FIRM|nr:hypothetical protein BRYFOR_07354 [Marvinbryantia formatexigens DSM 14469]
MFHFSSSSHKNKKIMCGKQPDLRRSPHTVSYIICVFQKIFKGHFSQISKALQGTIPSQI